MLARSAMISASALLILHILVLPVRDEKSGIDRQRLGQLPDRGKPRRLLAILEPINRGNPQAHAVGEFGLGEELLFPCSSHPVNINIHLERSYSFRTPLRTD